MPSTQINAGLPVSTAFAAGSTVQQTGGREGAANVQNVHGKWYAAALAGNLFMAGTLIAGVALPVAAGTLNSKFTIHNPASSTKIVELVRFSMGCDSATVVVNQIGLAIQRGLSTTSGIPTSTTALTSFQLGTAGGLNAAFAQVYSQATLTNVAIPGVTAATAVPIPFYGMFSMQATAQTSSDPQDHDFDGRVLLGPDSLGAFCTSVAAATAAPCNILWSEWTI